MSDGAEGEAKLYLYNDPSIQPIMSKEWSFIRIALDGGLSNWILIGSEFILLITISLLFVQCPKYVVPCLDSVRIN